MTDEQIAQHAGKMLGYVRRCFPRMDDDDRQHAVDLALAEVITRGADFQPAKAALSTYLCRAARNAACKLWKDRERGWFQLIAAQASSSDTKAVEPQRQAPERILVGEINADLEDAAARPPDAIAVEVERRGRQQLLLSDILQEYSLRCEQSDMQTQREIYERKLRGQDAKLIESTMGLTRNNIDQHLKRARTWIRERIQQADVERSVFLTLLRGTPDVPQFPDSVPADVPRNFHEVLMRVVNEFGALCPSDERLAQFEQQPQAVEFSDLRYHIEEVPCPLCHARRSLK